MKKETEPAPVVSPELEQIARSINFALRWLQHLGAGIGPHGQDENAKAQTKLEEALETLSALQVKPRTQQQITATPQNVQPSCLTERGTNINPPDHMDIVRQVLSDWRAGELLPFSACLVIDWVLNPVEITPKMREWAEDVVAKHPEWRVPSPEPVGESQPVDGRASADKDLGSETLNPPRREETEELGNPLGEHE
jgi:hypothetical protein